MNKITLMVDFAVNSIFFSYEDEGESFSSVNIDYSELTKYLKNSNSEETMMLEKTSEHLINAYYLSMSIVGNSSNYDETTENYFNYLLEQFAKKFYYMFNDDVELYVIDSNERHSRRLVSRIQYENHTKTIQFNLS